MPSRATVVEGISSSVGEWMVKGLEARAEPERAEEIEPKAHSFLYVSTQARSTLAT